MGKTMPNISANCKRYLFVFAAMLLVLLTSCAIKSSIKNFAGIPTNTEQGLPKSNQNLSTNTLENCAQFDFSDTQIVQKIYFNSNDLLSVILYTAAFVFLIGFRSTIKESKHPLYSGSGKIQNAVPLFLEYQKLIIHYSH